MNIFERTRRDIFDMSMREMANLLHVAPVTYRKFEKGEKTNQDSRNQITLYTDKMIFCAEMPEIRFTANGDDDVIVSIGEGTFEAKYSDLYDYFIFRPLVLRYTNHLLPRMKHLCWRENHLPALLKRMEK